MDSGEEPICEEYASSLEDLTFNSKPLINVLTMLAEENSQFASSITKLIENRIYQVPQQTKLPSLYLLDSIVKNVGGDYLHLVAQIMEKTFTCVFEKADEKTRRDLYKLRHTWQQYFPAKILYELDVAVNKHDPGWPISSAPQPPPSPSIHINPKFLKKAEDTGTVLNASISTPQEHKVVVDHQQRLIELQRLQEEQLKLTELEIQEHQMKRDLLLKKQQQERKLLLQQQQQQILHLRLKPDSEDSLLSNGPPSLAVTEPVSTKAETTESVQETFSSRDPRLRRIEKEPALVPEPITEEARKPIITQGRKAMNDRDSLPIDSGHINIPSGRDEIQTSGRPPEHFVDSSHRDLETAPVHQIKSVQHMAVVKNPPESSSRVQPGTHLEREVTGSPKYGDVQRPSRPKSNHKRRNSGDWSSNSLNHENHQDEPEEMQVVKGKPRRGRRRSTEKQRERGKGERGRGRGREAIKRGREMGSEQNDRRFTRQPDRDSRHPVLADRQVEVNQPLRDDWNSDLRQRNENFVPHDQGHWRRDPAELSSVGDKSRPGMPGPEGPPMRDSFVPKEFRGGESPMYGRDEFVRAGSPGMHEIRSKGGGHERERFENVERFKPHPSGQEMQQDPEFPLREDAHGQYGPKRLDPREINHPPVPFHQGPRDQPVGEPLSKKPRPLLSDMEINELRNRKGASPNTGRMTPPPVFQEAFHNHPFDRPVREPIDIHPHPLNAERPLAREHSFNQNFGPPGPGMRSEFRPHTPPMQQHSGDWTPGFEIPRELMLDHQSEIMRQAERRLKAGDLTAEQHDDLIDKLQQLYELQRHPEPVRFPPQENRFPPHSEHLPRHMVPSRTEEPPFRPGRPMDMQGPPPDVGPGRPMPPRFEGPPPEHHVLPLRGPAPMEPPSHMMRSDGPRFEGNEPDMRRFNDNFRGPPMEVDHPLHGRPMEMGGPPLRTDKPFDNSSRLDGGMNPQFVRGRPVEEIARRPTSHENSPGPLITPSTPPRQDKGQEVPHTPNTMMEKRSVDDLFRKLMDFGIIKVMPEPGSEPPRHVPSPGPPQADIQRPQPLPVPLPGLSLTAAAAKRKEPPKEEKPIIPRIKLAPEELKRRHDGVISSLYDGTQCSSCGLRFPGEAAKIYREHLDWHFRKNRREKDGRRVAHRQWYFVIKDWLNYEEISDPEERARSSVFDVGTGAVDSPDPLKEAGKEVTEGSCPVLTGDTDAEAECDICCEKFEQFWEETNEEWHYKSAVRIDGKTYHYLCYQDVKENQIHTEDDENEQERDEEPMDTSVEENAPEKDEAKTEEKSPQKDEAKTKVKDQGGSDKESKTPENKETTESKSLEVKTDKSDTQSSVGQDSCKGKGIESVSSDVIDNKKNETKGDEI